MNPSLPHPLEKIVVVGLGYVGLPLAVALAKAHEGAHVIGFDIDERRLAELGDHQDRTGEVSADHLAASSVTLTSSDAICRGADVIIVTVPTPVDADNQPDLGALRSASRRLASWIDPARRPTIVYESTVYPGATEEECGAIIEQAAGLVRGRDFRLGYSPERINPGDKVHTVDKIVKVIAGDDDEVLDQLDHLYGRVTAAGTYRAASIKAAEAAKAIENAQRDINIAFMNEVAQIFGQIDISVWDVLAAARTKWNFLPFEPGLVGGHCIGVDPYYLSHLAERVGHHPRVILSGRGTNDGMGAWIAEQLHAAVGGNAGRALVMGMTFKENVPDLRNSRSVDVVNRLRALGHDVVVHDPVADQAELMRMDAAAVGDPQGSYDLVVIAAAHGAYRGYSAEDWKRLVTDGGMLADLKGLWRSGGAPDGVRRWTL
nr:nucleotide sugar dehydrogenase [uncultured Sphingomonas sp.]